MIITTIEVSEDVTGMYSDEEIVIELKIDDEEALHLKEVARF